MAEFKLPTEIIFVLNFFDLITPKSNNIFRIIIMSPYITEKGNIITFVRKYIILYEIK